MKQRSLLSLMASLVILGTGTIPAQAQRTTTNRPNSALVTAIRNAVGSNISNGFDRIEYFLTEVDINNDGNKEVVVYTAGLHCGTSECPVYIFRRSGNSYLLIGRTGAMSNGGQIAVLPSRSNGWYDIATLVYNPQQRTANWKLHRFNGKSYQNTFQNLSSKPNQIILRPNRGSGISLADPGIASSQVLAQRTGRPMPVAEVFRSIFPQLKQQTRVPILLPSELFGRQGERFYASGRGDANGYRIVLGTVPNCNAEACSVGFFSAKRGDRPNSGGKEVRLARGITGYFSPTEYREPSQIEWVYGGVLYTIQMKVSRNASEAEATMIRLANSAIEVGLQDSQIATGRSPNTGQQTTTGRSPSPRQQNATEQCPLIDGKRSLPVTVRTSTGESPSYAFAETAGSNRNGKRTDGSQIKADMRCIFFRDVQNPNNPRQTWIITHGWNSNSDDKDLKALADEVAKQNRRDRVLMLDWSEASNNQGRVQIKGQSVRGVYYAATWIRPVAEIAVQELKNRYGMSDRQASSSLNLIGHSLGSLMSAEIGSIYNQGVNTITALDPPSEININEYRVLLDNIGGYDVDGRTPAYDIQKVDEQGIVTGSYGYGTLVEVRGSRRTPINLQNVDRPKCFGNASEEVVKKANCSNGRVARFSRAFVGKSSVAGNQTFAAKADESFQMDFGIRLVNPGTEHGDVIRAFTTLISRNGFGSLLGINDNRAHGEMKKDTNNYGHAGVIKINPNDSRTPTALLLQHSREGKVNISPDGIVFRDDMPRVPVFGSIAVGELGTVRTLFQLDQNNR